MKILKTQSNNLSEIIKETVKILTAGGLVVFPSDTVYGALVDAQNEQAVKKLITFKNRPPGKPISVFVSDFHMIKNLVYFDKNQEKILKEILPGCFTVVLKSKGKVSHLLESEKKTLGLRLINYQPIIDLVKNFGKPITATSANLGGKKPHYSIGSLLKQLPNYKKKLIDLIVDAGKLPRNKPSTVVDISFPEIKVLRRGDFEFLKNQEEYISQSENQTKEIAKKMIKKLDFHRLSKPLTIIIEGELGVGKTIFVKGLAEYFEIENIISPSFVIFYEYLITKGKFFHFDLYNIDDKEEFKYLKIEKLVKKNNLLVFEWGEKSADFFNLIAKKAKVIYIKMSYLTQKKRKIIIKS